MIYSGSRSSFDISEFRIQSKVPDPCGSGSKPYYLSTSLFGNIKNTLNSTKKKNLSIIFHFLCYTTVLQYTQSRIHREISVLFICSFISALKCLYTLSIQCRYLINAFMKSSTVFQQKKISVFYRMLIIIRNALVISRSLSVKSPFMRKDTVIFDTSVLFKKIGARKKTRQG